jgi:threonine dehydrogenase-like Zn-dependent dehydrogenase
LRQILQDLKNGKTILADVPCPRPGHGHLLIRTRASLVSAGTERMLVEFAQAGLINKARRQPDKVWQVLDKIKTDGIGPTIEEVQAKLDQPLAMGYCNVGEIIETRGKRIEERFETGDRVVSNGAHTEVVCVPRDLCVRVPEGVSDEEATFTVLGAIGLQGVRLAQPTIGECFVVTGLGLIGLITVQLLRANGCRVLGIDIDSNKCALARRFGAEVADLSMGEDPVVIMMMPLTRW